MLHHRPVILYTVEELRRQSQGAEVRSTHPFRWAFGLTPNPYASAEPPPLPEPSNAAILEDVALGALAFWFWVLVGAAIVALI